MAQFQEQTRHWFRCWFQNSKSAAVHPFLHERLNCMVKTIDFVFRVGYGDGLEQIFTEYESLLVLRFRRGIDDLFETTI